jgi:Pentapeptide repeats (8 copies)
MKRGWEAVRRAGRLPVVIVGIAGVLGLLWAVVVVAPPWFVDDDSLEGLKVQNEVRTTLLQGVAGAVLLAGAYFTYRQLHTAREGQITERYTRAIDHLGHAELDVRLGGIYALERIARDSSADRVTIGEVLTAFVRIHAPWPPSPPGLYPATAPIDQLPELQIRAPEIQASLTVLGRGGFALSGRPGDRLDLHDVDLRRANLRDAHLERAHLRRAHLGDAFLYRAHLEGAFLNDAHLEGAYLRGAHLERVDLRGAHLEGADFLGAHLGEVDLRGAVLEDGRNLNDAHLNGAKADGSTSWPAKFNWRGAGVREFAPTDEGETAQRGNPRRGVNRRTDPA